MKLSTSILTFFFFSHLVFWFVILNMFSMYVVLVHFYLYLLFGPFVVPLIA